MQMNIAKVQSVLKNMPDQQLMQMLRRPDKIPSMFIQQELRRRQQMRQASEANARGLGLQPPPPMPRQRSPQQAMGMSDGGNWFNNLVSNWKEGRIGAWHPEWQSLDQETKDAVVEKASNDKSNVKSQVSNQSVSDANMTDFMASQQRDNLVTSLPADHIVNQTTTYPTSAEIMNKNAKKQKRGSTDWNSMMQFIFPKLKNIATQYAEPPGSNKNKNQTNTNNNQNLVEVKPPSGQGGAGYVNRGTDGGDPEISQPPEKGSAVDEVLKNNQNKVTSVNAPPNIKINYDNTLAGQMGVNINDTIKRVNDISGKAQENIKSGISSINKNLENFKNSITEETKNFAISNDELKQLKADRSEHFDEAYKYVLNDQSIVDAQKKLIDAMSPKATASNKFFSYLAQLGARIAGSDKSTFAQAAGEALDKTLSEVKIDNDAERQNFVEQAKLGVELEEKRRANKIAALEFKSGFLNQSIEQTQTDIQAQNDITAKKIDAATKGANLTVQSQQALANMSTSLANLSLNQIGLIGDLVNNELTRADNRAVAQADLELNLAKLAQGNPDIQLLEYYQNLDEKGKGLFKEVMGLNKEANNSTVYSSLINAISKQITEIQANVMMPPEEKQNQIDILTAQLDQMKSQFGINVKASQSAGGSGQNYMTEEDFN
tara:strand:- start:3693 stop:5672 length:1980 start_codon:yes stop_codon:yes gene_type:complete